MYLEMDKQHKVHPKYNKVLIYFLYLIYYLKYYSNSNFFPDFYSRIVLVWHILKHSMHKLHNPSHTQAKLLRG